MGAGEYQGLPDVRAVEMRPVLRKPQVAAGVAPVQVQTPKELDDLLRQTEEVKLTIGVRRGGVLELVPVE